MPNDKGEVHENKSGNITIAIFDSYIFRTHRSHKPYGKDVDSKFKTKFIEAWKNEANDTYEKIC